MQCKTRVILMTCMTALSSVCISFDSETGKILSAVNAMEAAWSGVSDYTMQVEKTERLVDGQLTRQSVFLKFRHPNQYYFKVLEGRSAGAELIYPKSEQELVATAHPGGAKGKFARFLRMTVVFRRLVPTEFSLQDPSIVRGQHQTVFESNLGRTIELIARNIRIAAGHGEGEMQISEECSEDKHCMDRIDVDLPANTGSVHEVQEDENLWTLATQYDLPMYVIWYNNPDMRDPNDIHPGQSLFVPKYYAASGHIWISQDTGLLTKLEIFDSQGRLYERYVYSAVQTNIGLTDEDFDVNNPDYSF
jgi:outer membrane lipoprotein-sorting protein